MANNLKSLRNRAGFSQTALAEMMNTTRNQITKLEGGRRRLSDVWIKRASIALRVDPGELVTDSPLGFAPETPEPEPAGTMLRVPLIDEVTAGKLALPASQIPVEDVPLLAFADLGPGEFFALKVVGSSMDRVSPENSIIVANRRDKTLISGRCYIFSYQGETTYKRWQGGDPAYLDPFSTDPSYKPIFLKRKRDLEVVGRVKRTVLDL